MITLSGCTGEGTLLCTFYVPDGETVGHGLAQVPHLDYATPPTDWYLPPPDGVWYSVTGSVYGPRITKLIVGDIQSVNDGLHPWNPCTHSTITGDALYTGPEGLNAPYWTKPAASPVTVFTAADDLVNPPTLRPQFLTALIGRPCTPSDKKVYDRYGAKISQVLSAIDGCDRYYYYDTVLPGNIAPSALRSDFSQRGKIHEHGHWYAKNIGSGLATNPNACHWIRTHWSHPQRTVFCRNQEVEYHYTSIYIGSDRLGPTGLPNLAEYSNRITSCEVTHVRSTSPGRFIVRYRRTVSGRYYGSYPSSFEGTQPESNATVLTAALLVLEPGLTKKATIDVTKANEYCRLSAARSSLLYVSRDAQLARMAAIRDVQALDSNWIENLAGIKGTGGVISPLIDGWKAYSSGNLEAASKALASAYLVYKYVISPSLSDYADVKSNNAALSSIAGRNRFSNERRRGKFEKSNVAVPDSLAHLMYFCTLHMTLKDNPFSQIWNALERFGLQPTAGQAWDLVPFSFVIDWFANVGDVLTNLDSLISLRVNRNLRVRIESFKVLWPMSEETIDSLFDNTVDSSGSPLEFSWYDRRLSSTIGSVDPLDVSDDNGLSIGQMAQAGALLTQMR